MTTDPASASERAAAYFARMRSGNATLQEQQALEQWIESDEAHARAYERVSRLWLDLEGVRSHPAILDLREDANRGRWRTRLTRLAAAAAAIAVVAGGAGLWSVINLAASKAPPRPQDAFYRSRVGQMITVALSDGSTAILDTDSAIRFSEGGGRRNVDLIRGRALFDVRHDPSRPFVVRARGRTITALGTRFDVYLKPAAIEVELLQGHVRVQDQAPEADGRLGVADMKAGQKLVADAAGWRIAPIPVQIGAAWLQHRLIFDEAPIGDIAEELNRYSEKKIVVEPGVAQARMSAILLSNDPDTFVRSVQALHLARVEAEGDGYRLAQP